MLSRFARRLVFYTYPFDLTRDTTLLLSFSPPRTEQLYRDMFPTAWRVIRVSGGHVGTHAKADYSSRLAVGVGQVNQTNVTVPTTFLEIQVEPNIFRSCGKGSLHDDEPVKAINESGDVKDLFVGSLDTSHSAFLPIICWPNVNNGGTAAVKFTPELHVYACSDYKETDLIRGEVENSLGNWNLVTLLNYPSENRFHLFEDKKDGQRLRLSKD
ncbi:hypothetical protein BDV93DRAFT_587025 [Ceratobasidium sp. AG-I]|nr:hypothetical protein BDV93DRAFT_587025 [Ceratobasidium sp. AG-I]